MKRMTPNTLLLLLPTLAVGLPGCGAPSASESEASDPMGTDALDERATNGEDTAASANGEENDVADDSAANSESGEPTSPDVVTEPRPTETTGDFDAFHLSTCDGGQADPDDVTVVDSDVTGDQHWSGTVHVRGSIAASAAAALTIEPGTQIVMAPGSELDFGASSDAVLSARGSESEPIHFCGENPEAGSWNGITLGGSTEAVSELEHVTIAHAGTSDGYALVLTAAAAIDDVEISLGGGGGVYAVDFAEGSAALSVTDCAGTAVVLAADAALVDFPAGGEISANSDDGVHLRFDSIRVDAALEAGVTFVQEEDVSIENGAVLTLNAGVDYRVAAGADLVVGADGETGTLSCLGTEDAPVSISGEIAGSGSWGGIVLAEGTSKSSLLAHVEVRHAGHDGQAAVDAQAAVKLDHVLVADSDAGLHIGAAGLHDDSTAITFENVVTGELIVDANALVDLPECDFADDEDARVSVEGGVMSDSGAVLDLGVPYLVKGDLETEGDVQLTIAPGVEFEMAEGTEFGVGSDGARATIVAVGTADAMIAFRGETAAAGSWDGIVIGANVTPDSKLDHVEIQHAGGGLLFAAALTLQTDISVSNSSFVDSEGCGILKLDSDETDYVSTNTFTNVGVEVATTTLEALP